MFDGPFYCKFVILAAIVKKGSHGTSETRAATICTGGFIVGSGRAGTGVYFWAESPYWTELAAGWYRFALSRRQYDKEARRAGVIIFVEITVDETEVFYCENAVVASLIASLFRRMGLNREASDEDMARLWDGFIKEMERKQGVTYKVLEKRLAPPPREFCDYPIQRLDAPFAYMVRFPECVHVFRTERIKR